MKSFFSLLSRRNRKRQSARSMRRRGVAVVEAALCLIFVLLPVTLGGFQFAMIFITQHALQQIARESARYAAVHYNDDAFDDDVDQGDTAGEDRSLKNIMRAQAAANGISWNEINGTLLPGNLRGGMTVSPASRTQRSSGQPITITVTYPMKRRALLGSLFFKDENTKKISPMSLGFLQSNFTATSTTLME